MAEQHPGRPERLRLRRTARRERYEAFFDPRFLASAGLATSLAFLFQPSLVVRAIMFALFFIAAVASGKRVSPLATLLVGLGIVAANLLVPVGKVLYHLGPMAVTQFALLDGLGKAVTFEGLIHISKASIPPTLRLPGRFGSIVASAFVYYDRIVEYRGNLRPSSLMTDVDALMLKVWEEPATSARAEPSPSHSRVGNILLIAVTGLALGALVLRFAQG